MNPTYVDFLVHSLPTAWFEDFVITTVPADRRGHGHALRPKGDAEKVRQRGARGAARPVAPRESSGGVSMQRARKVR
ncbi:hypothetical protein JQ593_18110 [Bradyrhizobium viridifuturi]|nr:hypothetical protein [Bradyrhizobium viridifuturi]MBR1075007.1 hypothetical protein [Bradyrhizobium viridifuturi]